MSETEIINYLLSRGGTITTVFTAILWGGFIIKKYVINGQISKFYRLKMRELAIMKAILKHMRDNDRRENSGKKNEQV